MTETADFLRVVFFCTAEENLADLSQFILEELGVMICQQNNSCMIVEYALLSKPRGEVQWWYTRASRFS